MRASVAAAWPAHVDHYEGTLTWMYLDTKLKVTTGVGNLIDSIAAAQAAGPWFKPDGTQATDAEVATEWKRVKALTSLAKQSGWAYRTSARLNLTPTRVAELLSTTTDRFWAELVQRWPVLDAAPADAQLAGLDLAWQNGYAFLELKTGTSWTWPNMRAAWTAADWTKAAAAVPGTGERADARKRLFRNAAQVVALGLDRNVLWDTTTPTAPTTVLALGEEPYVAQAKVAFRGGWTCSCVAKSLPMVENYMLMKGLIQFNIDIFQLGYNGGGVAASAGTHDAGGCTDVGQYSDAQIQAWRECGWTMQHRTPAQGFSHHAHGWPLGCPHMSAGARSQATQWANGTNGLASYGRITGKYPIDNWQTAYTKRSAEIMGFKDDVAELAAKKVLAALPAPAKVPTAKEIAQAVLNLDEVPNTFTSNADNKSVSPKTALSTLGSESQAMLDAAKRIESAVQLLIAAGPTPPVAATQK